jgi:hypothetical protein
MKNYKVTLLVDQGWFQELAKMSEVAYTEEVFQWLSVEEVEVNA